MTDIHPSRHVATANQQLATLCYVSREQKLR